MTSCSAAAVDLGACPALATRETWWPVAHLVGDAECLIAATADDVRWRPHNAATPQQVSPDMGLPSVSTHADVISLTDSNGHLPVDIDARTVPCHGGCRMWPASSAGNGVLSNGNVISSPIELPGLPSDTSDVEFLSHMNPNGQHLPFEVHGRFSPGRGEFGSQGVTAILHESIPHTWHTNANAHPQCDIQTLMDPCYNGFAWLGVPDDTPQDATLSTWPFTSANQHLAIDFHPDPIEPCQCQFPSQGISEVLLHDTALGAWPTNANGHHAIDILPPTVPCPIEFQTQDVAEISQDATFSAWPITNSNGRLLIDSQYPIEESCHGEFQPQGVAQVLQAECTLGAWPLNANGHHRAIDVLSPMTSRSIEFELQDAAEVPQGATFSSWPTNSNWDSLPIDTRSPFDPSGFQYSTLSTLAMTFSRTQVPYLVEFGDPVHQAVASISDESNGAFLSRQDFPEIGHWMQMAVPNVLSTDSGVRQRPTQCPPNQAATDRGDLVPDTLNPTQFQVGDYTAFIGTSAPPPVISVATSSHEGCSVAPFASQPVRTQGTTEEPATTSDRRVHPLPSERHGQVKCLRGRCENGQWKRVCSPHAYCEHERRKGDCTTCGGPGICAHRRVNYLCKACGGKEGICQHERHSWSKCNECRGGAMCEHDRQRFHCKKCRGGGICQHDRRRARCKKCRDALTVGASMVFVNTNDGKADADCVERPNPLWSERIDNERLVW